jgi:hypothetical protein
MKVYFYKLFFALFSVTTFFACSESEGADPGSDSAPMVTIYQYKPNRPYNPDNDITIRFATNDKAINVYYFTEKTSEKNARITSIGEEGYKEYVVSNGKKLEGISGASTVDVTITDLYGDYSITAVAVGEKQKSLANTTFKGLEWNDVATGTYHFFNYKALGISSTSSTVLQVCTTNDNLYRFKDLLGKGYHLKINLMGQKGKDDDGEFQFLRIAPTETSFVSNGSPVSVRDIAYWQGNDSFATNLKYASGMYSGYSCFLCLQYYISGKSLGYNFDEFIVN